MHKLWFRDVKIEPLNVKCMFIIWRRSMLFHRRPYIVIRSSSKYYCNSNENCKKATGLDWQNNNFARESRLFVYFFAVVARLQRETSYFHVSWRT